MIAEQALAGFSAKCSGMLDLYSGVGRSKGCIDEMGISSDGGELLVYLPIRPLATAHMFWIFPPSRKPTPSEYAVLVVFVSLAFIVLGIVALVLGFRAPAEKHEIAVALEYRGAWCLGIGVTIAIGYWLYHHLVD